MPSMEQQKELIDNCSREWIQKNGIYGILVTSKNNDAKLFFPAPRYPSGFYYAYWSGTLISNEYAAYSLRFDAMDWYIRAFSRVEGYPVRAVCP